MAHSVILDLDRVMKPQFGVKIGGKVYQFADLTVEEQFEVDSIQDAAMELEKEAARARTKTERRKVRDKFLDLNLHALQKVIPGISKETLLSMRSVQFFALMQEIVKYSKALSQVDLKPEWYVEGKGPFPEPTGDQEGAAEESDSVN